MKRLIVILCVIAFVVVALTIGPGLLHISEVGGPRVQAYVIPLESEFQQDCVKGIALVNRLLRNNAKVYWLGEPLKIKTVNGSDCSLERGDFLIPAYQKIPEFGFSPSIFLVYMQKTSLELNVSIFEVGSPFEAVVYPLTKSKVAVYFGGGCTGGALEHIYPLEEEDFDLDIITQADIQLGNLYRYDIVTFPGGMYRLNQTQVDTIKDFVKSGGSFLGTCGGLVFGVQIGLLDVQLTITDQEIAFAAMRGPIILESMSPMNPITFGYEQFFKSVYFWSPFIDEVGSDVTVVASYYSPTQDLREYVPEVVRAYNFTLQTEIIDDYWGTPSIINGTYGNGRVILSTVHPEILPETHRIFVNSIYSLSSGERTLLKSSISREETLTPNLGQETAMAWNETLYSQAETLLRYLESGSGKALYAYRPFQYANNEIVGSTGEYLELFLSDTHSRSFRMLNDLSELKDTYTKLGELENTLVSAPGGSKNVLTYTENLQYKIASTFSAIAELEEPIVRLFHLFEYDLLNRTLPQIYLLSNASLTDSYQEIIELQSLESANLNRIKDGVDYYLLRWSFQMRSILIEADFLIGLSEVSANVCMLRHAFSASSTNNVMTFCFAEKDRRLIWISSPKLSRLEAMAVGASP